MEFADSYFEDEVRDGYYIPSIMKKAWAAEAEVLAAFQDVCERHHIDYFAEWGTLLGVIRHGGMIPWDDDLDVCMKSSDFKKFMAVADELPEECYAADYHVDDGTGNMVAKVANSKVITIPRHLLEKYHGFPYVAGIDIFCLDFLPPDKGEERAFRDLVSHLCGVINEVTKEREGIEVNWDDINNYLTDIEKFFHMKFDREKSIEIQLYDVLMDRLPSLYTEQEAKELTNLALWSTDENYRMPKSCFMESVVVPFENMEIRVPIGYEELVQKKYGGKGYMNPVRSGGSHDYPYFEKIEKMLKEKTSVEIFEYKFSFEELEQVEKEREEERQNKEEGIQRKTKAFLPLFQEAHESLIGLLLAGDFQSAVELMGDCQNVAIELGTLIEQECGEGHDTVRILEAYCDLLFEINQKIIRSVEEKIEFSVDVIQEQCVAFEEELTTSINEKLKEKREIVFVPYKPEQWGTMSNAWKKAMEEEDVDVYVIPAPYYYKDAFGDIKLDEMQYELDGYPEGVSLTTYQEYNFQAHHPDTIVIQCPYDDFNYALSIHPFFFASNLKKYTEQLIYIPGFLMDEIRADDERMRKMLRYYCNMPGVVHADQVIVQSEQMRKVYIELLTEFAGNETKPMWEQKICSTSVPFQDETRNIARRKRENLDIPDEWLPVLKTSEGEWKKIILYTTSGGAMRMDGEKAVQKMENVMKVFEQNKDQIALIWRPDPNVKNMIRKSEPRLWQEYRDFLQEYRENGIGILDNTPTPELSIALCDACYGDGGSTMNTCREQKKPVMIQNVDC